MRLTGRQSLTFRLTLLFASVSTAVLLVLGFLIRGSVEQHFEEQDMQVLSDKLAVARRALEKVESRQGMDAIPQQLDDSLVGDHGLVVVVLGPDKQVLFATRDAPFPQALLDQWAAMKSIRPYVWQAADQQPFRGIVAEVATGVKGWPPAVIAVATDISHHQQFMASFQKTLWLVVVAAAVATGFLGWIVARRGLAPLRVMKQKASEVTAHHLDHRLPAESVPIELAELADTLNDMLARLEESFLRLSDFSSDLAHELRTPVSNLMTQTQVALSKTRSPAEYREVLESNAEEFERLSRIIADMLFLAKADNHLIIPNREPVDLAAEARELIEFYEALAEESGIGLDCTGEGRVIGDRLMLRRAISNLLSNAVRHTPRHGLVQIHIDESPRGGVRVVVENTGETIPAEHLSRLFDRFHRVDPSRQRFSEGAGLGLAITRSILRAHGGDVEVHSERGLTRFGLTFPISIVG